MSYFENRWKIKGTVLSPVHIGCDEQLDPFSIAYEEGKLIEFDLGKAVASAHENTRTTLRTRLDGTLSKAEQVDEIRKLILAEIPWREFVRKEYLLSYEVENSFGQNGKWFISKTRQAAIQLTAHNTLTGERIIPGSSLKGALRSAVLSARAKPELTVRMSGNQRDDDREYERFQKQALGYSSIETDPFGEWKVSDCRVAAKFLSVIDTPELHRRGINKESMAFTDLTEVLDSAEAGPHFEGTLSVARRLDKLRTPVTLHELLQSIRKNTRRAFVEAYEKAPLPMSFPESAKEDLEGIREWMDTTESQDLSCVVRLGRFGGFLNMTVEHQRYLRAFKYRGEVKREALSGTRANPTLRALTRDGLPFGFVKLEFEELPK